jgi:hypothetical protein
LRVYLPSMSGLERASICPASQVFPHEEVAHGGLWQGRGNVLHAFLKNVPAMGVEAALDLVPAEFRVACAKVDVELLETMQEGAFAQEVAFGLDIYEGTARELKRGAERADAYADRRPGELVGTVDVVGVAEDAVVVYDYKTGYRFFDVVERNWQLLAYAIAAALTYGKQRAHLAIIRVPEHGEPYFIRGTLEAADLRNGLEALRQLNEEIAELRLRRIAGERVQQVTGEHCKFCPAVAACPSIARLQRRLTSTRGLRLPPLDAASAPQYLEAFERGRFALEQLGSKLKAYAALHPIELPDGYRFGTYPRRKASINVNKALPILEALMDGEAALASVKEYRAITMGKLEDAIRELRKRRKGVKQGKKKKEVLAALGEAGAIKITTTYPVGVHKAPPAELTEGEHGQGFEEEAGAAEGDPAGEA